MPPIHPLTRLAKAPRLVVAVRGAAGTGKSTFAATLADAGLGHLCFFDTERKARFLPGSDGTHFDALEIEHPDELLPFIDWALTEGRTQRGYGCFVLDSWAMYFGRKHAETLRALRASTGDPLAQPNAELLSADQVVLQEVLRRLCVDSGASVVITDQIGARGKEEREENELGRVLPMTASGLEYFVDVLLELTTRMEGFELVHVGRVVKSNSAVFPLGLELVNPTFTDLLSRLPQATSSTTPGSASASAAPIDDEIAALIAQEPAFAAPPAPTITLDNLIEAAEHYHLTRAQLVTAARHYHHVEDLARLTPAQVKDLHTRLVERYSPPSDAGTQAADPGSPDSGKAFSAALEETLREHEPIAPPAANNNGRRPTRNATLT
jgi:hypothetical protein